MAGKPVATVGSMHVCPLCSGTVPHVGGPVIGPGDPTVLMNGKPVAVMGDMCTCAGPPDTIIQGNPNILVNGKPIACVGDMTAHGGSIVMGEPNILVGTATPEPSTYIPLKEIPFPKITLLKVAVAKVTSALTGNKAETITEARENIEQAKEGTKKYGDLSDFGFSV